MNIGKKLYLSFGGILATVVLLAVVILFAVWREHETKAAAQRSMDMTQATSTVRFEMMQNRLHLQNYLLSGDTRDVEKMNEGVRRLGGRPPSRPEPGQQRPTARQPGKGAAVRAELEPRNLPTPLVDKRRQVDSGNATVAELQIFYLQKDPSSWVSRSSDVLDQVDQTQPQATGRAPPFRRMGGDLHGRHHADDFAVRAGLGHGDRLSHVQSDYGTAESTHPRRPADRRLRRSGSHDRHRRQGRDRATGAHVRLHGEVPAARWPSVSEAIAGGNLTVEVQPRSANDTLGNAFTRMVEGLRGLVRNVRDAASQVASASTQVAGASDESAKNSLQTSSAIDEVTSTMHEMSVNVQNMVKSTQTQASSVSETSASIDQMVTSIQRVADTAKVLLDISNRSREEVHSGIGTMEKATDGLNRINTTIRSSGEIIDALGSRADNIGKIVEVIDDLAEQTNLLALNAAIEAARAGEHGLGFAVVADEVRKLAEKSAQSTKEISDLIQSIQKEARRAVDNMEKSTSIVNEGLNLGTGTERGAAEDFERGHRGLQVCAGNRRRHQRAVAWLVADRSRNDATERNHARDQLRGRGAGFGSAGGGQGHGAHAGTGAELDLRLHRTGRFCRTDVEDVAGSARTRWIASHCARAKARRASAATKLARRRPERR